MERFFQGVEGKKAPSDLVTFSLPLFLSFFLFFLFLSMHYLCVFDFFFLSQSSFMLCFVEHVFVYLLLVFLYFVSIKIKIKIEKSEKYKNSVCFLYIETSVPWMAIEIKFSKLCIFCSLDELM